MGCYPRLFKFIRFADADWLTLLVEQLDYTGAAAVGGPNLTPDDGNGFVDVFVRDLMARTTTLASVGNNANTLGMYAGANYALSASGRVVAYMSAGDQGLSEDRNNDLDIFARDLDTGTTSLVSVNQFGLTLNGFEISSKAALCAFAR